MERITNTRLKAAAESLNRRLEGRGSPARVVIERRYGYVAIDEADERGAVRRTLTTGHTAREAWEALQNMMRALDLLP
jgi:hypothetical protein